MTTPSSVTDRRLSSATDKRLSPATDKMPCTLDELVAQRRAMRQAVRIQQEKMVELARESFAPVEKSVSKGEALMRAFNTGMAVFDGVMLGMKVMRRVRKLLR